MKVHHGYKNLSFRNPVVTMGVFDGVHLGHRMLLRRVVREAENTGSDSVAVTFDPHPRIVLTGDPAHLRFLTDIDERIDLLRETGIGHLVIIPFTLELSRMTASEFVERYSLPSPWGQPSDHRLQPSFRQDGTRETTKPFWIVRGAWISGSPGKRLSHLTERL